MALYVLGQFHSNPEKSPAQQWTQAKPRSHKLQLPENIFRIKLAPSMKVEVEQVDSHLVFGAQF
jgi:hypothetical protein